jgi:hypothetical protein
MIVILTSFPRAEVATHQEIVETRDANELEKLSDSLLHDGFLHVETLETLVDLIEDVENLIHCVCRMSGTLHCLQSTIEEATAAIADDEAW